MELSYISENGNPEKRLIFQEVNFLVPKIKRNYSLGIKRNYSFGKCNFLVPSLKNFYISGKLQKVQKPNFIILLQKLTLLLNKFFQKYFWIIVSILSKNITGYKNIESFPLY